MSLAALQPHPHAAAVLGPAAAGRPSHAYLLHGPAGSGKRSAARAVAAELLARDAPDPEGARRRAQERGLAEELQFLPRKEHKRRETEVGEQARRAERRAHTAALDHGLQLVGLWYRDLACVAAAAPELAHNSDRAPELAEDAADRSLAAFHEAAELVDDARARLSLNVMYDLACEALAFRLERLFA